MDLVTSILYITSICFFLGYIVLKYRKKHFILSITNGYILQYSISLFIIPMVTFSSIAWIKLLGDNADKKFDVYLPYLLESIRLNSFGFIIFIVALIYFELNKKNPKFIYKLVRFSEKNIRHSLLQLEFIVSSILWLSISIGYSGGFSVLASSNISSGDGIVYYLNFILQSIIVMLTLYLGIYSINNKSDGIYLLIGLIECFLMGKRATFIMDILFALIVYYLYKKTDINKRRKVIFKVFKYIVGLIILALFMGAIRSSTSDSFSMVESFLYGNTFSDIRDGAMILYGFENNFNSVYAYGSTYISAILSFLPSSISPFRYEWDWGRFSTLVLLGWEGHPGLRGGWSIEGYLNFGYIGIICSSILSAYIYANMEKFFYLEMFNNNSKGISAKAVLILYICATLARRITCSAAFFAVYVMVFFILFNVILTKLLVSNSKEEKC